MEHEINGKLELSINDFIGPIDLLYSMIKEKKFDIMNLDLFYVCNKYLEYVSEYLHLLKIDDMIGDLSMITYFIEYKSKKVLPVNEDMNNIDEDIEKDKFIQRILMQKQFKEIVPKLEEKFEQRSKLINRDDNSLNSRKSIYIEDTNLPESISPKVLLNAFRRVYKNLQLDENNNIKTIEIKELSIDEVTNEIVEILKTINNSNISLFTLFNTVDKKKITKQYMAVAFVSILVLARHGYISLKQDNKNDNEDIYISIIDINDNINISLNEVLGDENEQ